jgi:hypothetical protein
MNSPTNTCNINFITQYAYVGDKCMHINEYIKNKNDKITCMRGHELVLCQGPKVKKYFRHKNNENTGGDPMTKWHCRMQSYFPVTEFSLKKINEKQIKERRADALIKEHNCIVEFEHSGKTVDEVVCKSNDCSLHNMDIIWLIDGNTKDIELEELSTGNFLVLFKDEWKYKSFSYTYDFVLLDINDKIFKIPVKKVCNKMILLKEWKPIDAVMETLNKNPKQIWNEWQDDNEIKATLTVQQKGAGNGKTYGIWKNIISNLDKEVFIIVTKQHSAKSVILKELNDQAERNEYHITNNILEEYEISECSKKYIVEYKHIHSHRKCLIIIGTVDSLIWNLSSNKKSNINFFEGVLQTIEEFGINKIDKTTGSINYAGKNIILNKKSELWLDEGQDLDVNYFNVIVRLMLETKMDVVIVGDKLQSLEYKVNCMTCVENDIPNINIIREMPENLNRRIKVDGMANDINQLINFDKFALPQIKMPTKLANSNQPPIEIIETPVIYSGNNDDNAENRKKLEKHVDDIMRLVDKEVNENNYLPHNFLFIFPIMKQNQIASELETKLNAYWIEKNKDEDKYVNYAILHKHEDGQVIDTSMSENSARIVSIRTSKGDGREVVFVLGCTETSLKLVSGRDDADLIYESYIHVALTRAKNKIYFALVKNNDDVHQRFGSERLVEFMPNINVKMNCDKIINYINKYALIELLKNNGIEEIPEEKIKEPTKINQPIDWEYHCVRRAIYLQYARFTVFEKNKDNNNFCKSQLKTVLDKISKLSVNPRLPNDFYGYLNQLTSETEMKEMPLCNMARKPIYNTYMHKIKKLIEKNITEYKKDYLSLCSQTPVEAVLQSYVIGLFIRKKYNQTTPTTIYNIIDNFEKDDSTKITELLRESEIIKNTMTTVMTELLNADNTVQWNIEHMIEMHGKCPEEFQIWNRDLPIIGFGEKTVYHFMFQSDFNGLNFWDTMIKVMIERFMLYNPADKGKDVEKFKDKQIKTHIFILKQNKCEIVNYEWDNEIKFSMELKKLVRNGVVKYFSTFNKQLYNYCFFVKKSDEWKADFSSPYDYIASKYSKVYYVRDFFKNLHERSKDNKLLVKNITDNCDVFCEKITEKIEEMCDKFFGFTEQNDDDW